jgi:DNA-binding NarL/FixJ family response regulator
MTSLAVPVVVVDDHQMVVLGLRTLFHGRPDVRVVAWAHDAEQALDACREQRPAVAVLDAALDKSYTDGLALCRALREELPQTEVVFYTAIEEMALVEKAFDTGAKGVVSKADQTGNLLKAVLLASRGKTYTSPLFVARASRRDFDELPPKQLAALRLLAQGLERREIATQMGISDETVKTHLAEVRRRLGARTSAQAVAIGLVNSLFDLPPGRDDLRPS